MESKSTGSPKGPRTALIIGGSVLAVAVIAYFSLFYPPTPKEDCK